ncbi:MAG: transcription antitermination factor NusB [Gammaproteobacteria bacterium]|jgi:N utilization substance protein B
MNVNPSKRHKARRYAVQALYHWQMTDDSAQDVIDYMMPDVNQNKTDLEYFEELVHKVIAQRETIDEALVPHLDRDLASVDPVERAILRLATYELQSHPEIPYRVVINEAIEQCKTFGAEEGHKYVNGVMDKAAAIIREVEFTSHNANRD